MSVQTSSSANNDPLDHHFVPIFYQSAWAAEDDRVVRFSRPRDRVVAKSCAPSRTGSAKHLYSHYGVALEHQAYLETQFFSPVDSRAAIAHRHLIGRGPAQLSPEQRVDWARFMMSMQLRSPFALGEVWRLADHTMRNTMQVSDREYDALRKPGDPATLYDWTAEKQPAIIENIHKTWLPNLIDHEDLGSYLINMDWSVVDVSTAKRRLLTGDRPLIATHGWKDPRTTLLFPLSPTRLFAATNGRMQTIDLLKRSPAFLARFTNEQVTQCAVDFVIGVDSSALEFVERHLRKVGREPIPSPFGKGQPNCPA